MKDIKNILVLIETSRTYGRSLIDGILEYCKFNPKWLIHLPIPSYIKSDSRSTFLKDIQKGLYDGIMGHVSKKSDCEIIFETRIPSVLQCIHADFRGQRLECEDKEIGAFGARFFREKGLDNIAFFGCDKLPFSRDRKEGLKKEVKKNHFFSFSTPINIKSSSTVLDKIQMWLKELPKPIGILACNDEWANILSKCCNLKNIDIPQDVSILGVDNDELTCKTTWPYLSSIQLNAKKAGFEAARLLDEMMKRKEMKPKKKISILPMYVVERQSTDIAITTDQVVSKTLEFIKANIEKPLQVTDILDHLLISRRSLQEKFKNTLGCSVLYQIRKMQIDNIAYLLTETDLSITEILVQCHFTTLTNLSRQFKKYKGLTPTDYRKQYKSYKNKRV